MLALRVTTTGAHTAFLNILPPGRGDWPNGPQCASIGQVPFTVWEPLTMNVLYYGDNLEILRTIEELLVGKAFHMPPTNITLAQAQRVKGQGRRQGKLLLGEVLRAAQLTWQGRSKEHSIERSRTSRESRGFRYEGRS